MLIVCPNCGVQSRRIPPASDRLRLRCSSCRAVFQVVRKKRGTRLRVVLAAGSAALHEQIRELVVAEPVELLSCSEAGEALALVQSSQPALLLLDVALPGMFVFQLCEKLRENPALSALKVVLISSVYDKSRYKRAPSSLYGADDYIEIHQIPERLVPMIYRLTGVTPAGSGG